MTVHDTSRLLVFTGGALPTGGVSPATHAADVAALEAAIDGEATARAADVAALEAAIDGEATARAAAILAEATARESADNLGNIIRLSSVTGSANAATGSVQSPQAHIAITGRQRIQSLWPTTNDATNPTLTIGATAYTIKRRNGSALAAGDLRGGAVYDFVLDPDAVDTLRLMCAVAVGDIAGLRGELDALAATDLDLVDQLAGKLDRAEISGDTGLSAVIVDQNDTPTWIEAGLDGLPTPRVGSLVGPVIDRLGGAPLSADTGLSFALTVDDSAGRECVTDLEFRGDGRFSDRAIRSIAERFEASDFAVALNGFKPVSGPDICCLGDSLTAGAGGTPYPTVLASLSGRTVHNLGVGGETSRTITGRIGARPWLATVSGGSIPASGGVTVTLAGDDGAVSPLDQGSAGVNPCSIAGVVGTLSKSGGVYTFTRSASGSAVTVEYPAPVITAASADRANDILVIEIGQNDATNDATDIIARVQAIIEWMAPLKKRWIVGGLSTSSAEYRAPYEAQMLRAFGRRFVNNREWLSSQACQDYLGLTPDAGHLAEMASGAVPANIRSDATHLNSLGYQAKAYFIYQRKLELGFLEG